jgi:sugar lactone lactonase YvrE
MKTLSIRICVTVCAALVLCGGAAWSEPKSKLHRATIHPSVVNLQPGAEQGFKVVMLATRLMAAQSPESVTWSVNDVPGGNETFGTIDANGVYRAPATVPKPREVHIGAEVPDAANRYLYATVIVGEGEPRYRSVGVWSEKSISEETGRTEHMLDPHGIAIDRDGNLIIADQLGSKLLRFTKEGQYLGELGRGRGSEEGQVNEPRIVAVARDGRIYVSDSKGDRPRIQIFGADGAFQSIFGEKGRWDGMLLRCHGLDFDENGRLFATDVDNMRVNVYSSEGEFLYQWGEEGVGPGQMNAPHGIFVDRSNDVFVTGYYGPTQKFSPEGDFVSAFGHGDPPDGPVYFHNMTGDRWGNVYVLVRTKAGYQGVAEAGGKGPKRVSLVKYNNNGDYVTSWAFSAPKHTETSATVDADGRVYALFKGAGEMGVETFEEE